MDSVTRHISRRRFIALSAAAAGAAVLAACGGSTAAPTPTTQSAAARPTQAPITVPTTAPTSAAASSAATAPTAAAASSVTSPTITAGATPAGAAQGKPGGTKIFRTANFGDVVFMDPAAITGNPDYQLGEAIFNFVGRYTYNPPLGTQINAELAEGWELQDNAKTYIFHLRKGVKFHDGTDCAAAAVKYNWDRIKDPKTASRYQTDFAGSTITVLDPTTLKVAFDHPYPAFIPASLAFRPGMIISPTAYQAAGEKWKTHPVGSGPFMWDNWQVGSSVTLKRNPDYWSTKPKLDQIIYKFKLDDRSAGLAVAKGELDAFYIDDPDVALSFAKTPDPNTVFRKAEFGTSPYWLAYNLKRKPLDDVRVRQALRYAIDVNSIAKDLFGGLADPIHSFLPPFMFGYSAEITQFNYNPDKAKQLLKDANVPSDWNPSMIADSTSVLARKIVEAVNSYWTDVGVKSKVELPDSGTFQKRRSAGDYDIFGIGVGRIDPDQIATPYWHTGSTVNNSFYTGADDLIDMAKAEADPKQRAKLYRDLQDKVSQDSPAAFIVATSSQLLVNKRVTGISGAGWQYRYDWFNIDVPAE